MAGTICDCGDRLFYKNPFSNPPELMTDDADNRLQSNTIEEFAARVDFLIAEIQELYCSDDVPWIVGVSWGKDSTAILQLIWQAISKLPPQKRHKLIHIITTDTQVENPIVANWVKKNIAKLATAAKSQDLPFSPHLLFPATKDSFWVNLIGKGYPAPRPLFRWCTDRLKINSANQFIRETLQAKGEVILALGIRKAESNNRNRVMTKYEKNRIRERLTPHSKINNTFLYSPIEDWTTAEVWLYLMQWPNPWDGDNNDLFTLYRGATADNECPLVVDTSTPSCGDSRFGCWVCTMVSKDKSMEAMIQNDLDKQWLQPLLDFRNELDIPDDRDKRDFRRIYGRVELFERKVDSSKKADKDAETSLEPIPGPYTKEWREYWLRQLLTIQTQLKETAPAEMQPIELITLPELREIQRIWLTEKHEFDDCLPQIYQEATGMSFPNSYRADEGHQLGHEEWSILEDLCGDDPMFLELVARLLNTERQNNSKYRRGIYDKLEKCFDTSSRNKEEAIERAVQKRSLKEAVDRGDVAKVKQLTWANFKFADESKE